METSELKYDLSTDYEKLFSLLKNGHKIVGFVYQYFQDKYQKDYSIPKVFSYSHGWINLDTSIPEGISNEKLIEYCNRAGVRYFMPNLD